MSLISELLSSARLTDKKVNDYQADVDALLIQADVASKNIYEVLRSHYLTITSEIGHCTELESNLHKCLQNVDALKSQINVEIIPSVDGSADEVKNIALRLKEVKMKMETTQFLYDVHCLLEESTTALCANEFMVAVESLKKAKQFLADASTNEVESELEIIVSLQNQLLLNLNQLTARVDDEWRKFIWFSQEETIDKNPLIRLSVQLALLPNSNENKSKSNHWHLMILALELLDELTSHIQVFGKNLLKYIIRPILTEGGRLDVHAASRVKVHSITLKKPSLKDKELSTFSAVLILDYLEMLFTFLHSRFCELPLSNEQKKTWFMEYLGNEIGEEFINLVLTSCLEESVPTDKKSKESFTEVQLKVEDFHKFLVRIGFYSESNRTFVNYITDFDSSYGKKTKINFLSKARDLITCSLDKTVLLTPSDDSQQALEPLVDEGSALPSPKYKFEALSSNTFQFPNCHVSESICRLLDLIYAILDEAFTSTPQFAKELFWTVRNVFSLYIRIVPISHRRTLASIPQHSALVHNNSLLLSHHAMFLGTYCKGRFPFKESLSPSYLTAVDLGHEIRSCGCEVFLSTMQRYKAQMIDKIQLGLDSTSLKFNGTSVEPLHNAVQECSNDLKSLGSYWKNILPETVYAKSIGTLAGSLVEKLIHSITSLEEISAEDVKGLINILGIVKRSFPSLFTDASEVFAEIVLWEKLGELIIVLEANLHDLGERWACGKGPLALHFSPSELRNLIKAIFQNTERRAQVLARIE